MTIKNKAKQFCESKTFTIIIATYNFIWSIVKIILGIIETAYFLCLSGIVTMLIGMTKIIFIRKVQNQNKKIIFLSTFLILIGIIYSIYMARYLFTNENLKEYSEIIAITIALASFIELGTSIFSLIKANKKKDSVVFSYKIVNFSSSLFALVNTQSALLAADNIYDVVSVSLFGIVSGIITTCLGIFLLIKNREVDKNDM